MKNNSKEFFICLYILIICIKKMYELRKVHINNRYLFISNAFLKFFYSSVHTFKINL